VAGEPQRYARRQGHDFLWLFARPCRGRDLDPQAVYAAMGGLPALEPEGETVAQGTRAGEGHGRPYGSPQRRKLVRGLTWPHTARWPDSTGAVQRCTVRPRPQARSGHVGAPHPIRIVRDPTIVTQRTQGPDGSAQKRVIPGEAPVTPLAATRARRILGAASAGVRDELSLRFTATDARRAHRR